MSNSPESVSINELNRRPYLEHWSQFADEQIFRDNSPIRENEQMRFRAQCEENGQNLVTAQEAMIEEPSYKNVHDWYSRLGTTNSLEGAEPDLVLALSSVLKSPEAAKFDDDALLLAGNLAQELAEQHEGVDAEGYYAVASKCYGSIVKHNNDDLGNPNVRQAVAHSFDIAFAQLSLARLEGRLSQSDFDTKYQERHVEFVRYCRSLAANKDSGVGDGELFEHYGEMLVRHRLWARERFGEVEIRRSFTAREDRPKDGFRRGGRHVNQTGALPSYSFDLKVSSVDGSEADELLQLKADHDDHGRYAIPPIRLFIKTSSAPLRSETVRIADIMLHSYTFEATELEEQELLEAEKMLEPLNI